MIEGKEKDTSMSSFDLHSLIPEAKEKTFETMKSTLLKDGMNLTKKRAEDGDKNETEVEKDKKKRIETEVEVEVMTGTEVETEVENEDEGFVSSMKRLRSVHQI